MEYNDSESIYIDPITGAKKGVKLARFDLIPPSSLFQLAELYGKGAIKYGDRNWEAGYDYSKSFAALNRHLWKWWSGEDIDLETEMNHLVSVAWHAFSLLHFIENYPEKDDRGVRS